MSYTYSNFQLPLEPPTAQMIHPTDRCALESCDFPFEKLSEIAELESWRKEINRPIYHLHKWWAQRLGSVFRGILLGAIETDPQRVIPAFFEPSRCDGVVVFDPFMGSGTTIGEALKLGMRGIGRDINHVAYFAVRNALTSHRRADVISAFEAIKRDVADEIGALYRTQLTDGSWADVLYYFWVKVVPCPACDSKVDLFSTFIFSRHAYPKKHPAAQVICPHCGEVSETSYDVVDMACSRCQRQFNPQVGPARGQQATCPHCEMVFPIAAAVKRSALPPEHRLYAKLVLTQTGTKIYQRATDDDVSLYEEAARRLAPQRDLFPIGAILPGHNTNQVLAYGYGFWHEMFNARQLLSLGLLSNRIRAIEEPDLRNLFGCLFSGMLEFNNMFASFKGEGTGAVRHMFAHHILKPERTPVEGNPWGTPKSSGAFSTLFRSRLLPALHYHEHPFEIRPTPANGKVTGRKIYGLSRPFTQQIADSYDTFLNCPETVYLSCGDSAATDLRSESVDLVITDPPFFDNVHYSELADFFHVWQRFVLREDFSDLPETTRSDDEVQSRDSSRFAERLCGVFRECHRVLRPGGLLSFTYHHSKSEGWRAIVAAVTGAEFVITAAHPIKSEMSVAAPKAQARSPIDLDVIFVCRRRQDHPSTVHDREKTINASLGTAADQIDRFSRHGRILSRNDVKVIVMAQLAKAQTFLAAAGDGVVIDLIGDARANNAIELLYARQKSQSSGVGAGELEP